MRLIIACITVLFFPDIHAMHSQNPTYEQVLAQVFALHGDTLTPERKQEIAADLKWSYLIVHSLMQETARKKEASKLNPIDSAAHDNTWYCQMCSLSFVNNSSYKNHLKSSRHKINVVAKANSLLQEEKSEEEEESDLFYYCEILTTIKHQRNMILHEQE